MTAHLASGRAAETLRVDGLTKKYYGVTAVDDVSLDVAPGEIVGLIGPNGSGKTTFLDCISGVQHADSGRVFLGATEITGNPSHRLSRRHRVTRTFQAVRVFETLNVRDNILVGALGHSNRGFAYSNFLRGRKRWEPQHTRVDELITELNIGHVADLPAGSLSYGQRKLLELATALVERPRILLLDEPVAAVNPTLANTIRDHILGLANRGVGVLLVEHNIELVVGVCHRLIVLDNGQKIAEGTPQSVMAVDRVQEAYFGR
jgi:branched-chain amino acid transport system ATP-binding protein